MKAHFAQENTENSQVGSPHGSRPEVVSFVHIPKCAGTSFKQMLRAAYGHNFYPVSKAGDWLGIRERVHEGSLKHDRTAVLGGPYCWGIHDVFEPYWPVRYITMLRSPVEVFISHYTYSLKLDTFSGPIEDFALSYEHNHLHSHLKAHSLEAAKYLLRDTFDWFGIVESFDESVSLLSQRLGRPLESGVRANVSRSRKITLPPQVLEYFQANNQEDIALYAWARELFLSRCKSTCRAQASITANIDQPVISPVLPTRSSAPKVNAFSDLGIATNLYLEGRKEESTNYFITAAANDERCLYRALPYLLELAPEKGRQVLERALIRNTYINSCVPNSAFNSAKQSLLSRWTELLLDRGDLEEARENQLYAHNINILNKTCASATISLLRKTGDLNDALAICHTYLDKSFRCINMLLQTFITAQLCGEERLQTDYFDSYSTDIATIHGALAPLEDIVFRECTVGSVNSLLSGKKLLIQQQRDPLFTDLLRTTKKASSPPLFECAKDSPANSPKDAIIFNTRGTRRNLAPLVTQARQSGVQRVFYYPMSNCFVDNTKKRVFCEPLTAKQDSGKP